MRMTMKTLVAIVSVFASVLVIGAIEAGATPSQSIKEGGPIRPRRVITPIEQAKPSYSVTGATLIACGEIDAEPSVAQQDEPQTVMGHVNVMDSYETPRFKPGCPRIQASLGTRFGVSVQINGSPYLEVVPDISTRVTHPPMTNPATREVSIQSEWMSPMNIGYARYAGWQFEEPWELVPGVWKIEILRGKELLVAKEFTVETK